MDLSPRQKFTPEEYLELERKAGDKSEYFLGIIYALAGAGPDHSAITANLTSEVVQQLRGKPCRALNSDMKIRTGYSWLYSYPDLSVVCEEPIFHDDKQDVIINPKVIFEVLSPSTEEFDRGVKFLHYQAMDTFTDYVLIAQEEPRVEHFIKQQTGWFLTMVSRGLGSRLHIASIDCTISLAQLYDKIKFPEDVQS